MLLWGGSLSWIQWLLPTEGTCQKNLPLRSQPPEHKQLRKRYSWETHHITFYCVKCGKCVNRKFTENKTSNKWDLFKSIVIRKKRKKSKIFFQKKNGNVFLIILRFLFVCFCFVCTGALSAGMSVYYVDAAHIEARRGCQILQNRS